MEKEKAIEAVKTINKAEIAVKEIKRIKVAYKLIKDANLRLKEIGVEWCPCGLDEIHIFHGLSNMADALGIQKEHIKCDVCLKGKPEQYDRYSFDYEDLEIFQLGSDK